MKKLGIIVLSLLSFVAGTRAQQRPKLVVGIVVDQMRWDYLQYYKERFGSDGFNRLQREGFSFDNTQIGYVPTVTACGHSCLYTGSIPALTGIAGNNFYVDGKRTYCTEDKTVQGVGSNSSAGQMSPRNLEVSTIGDELKVATNYQSKVIGISLKDRGAILPAGHAADAAYWYDAKNGIFISSTYYQNALPEWVKKFNATHHQTKDIRCSSMGNTLVADMAIEALGKENLGKDDITDLLTVSFSSTDYVGHRYGPFSAQLDSVYLSLDHDLGRLLTALDEKVGKGNYIVFLSADHAAPINYKKQNAHGIPAGVWDEDKAKQYPGVKDVIENRIYLSDSNRKDEIIRHFQQEKGVAWVIDFSHVNETTLPDYLKKKVIQGYHPQRSGDLIVILKPGYYESSADSYEDGINHGAPYSYDSHIPLLWMGRGIPQGRSIQHVSISDVAPIVCALLGIQAPTGCVGEPHPFQ